ncbi:MAG: NAD(P)/FAD-dependent oxidoreductase [Oscillatoriales cyanobacterium]|jgi:predicted Rossmann fold flavoprotein|uniref:NAD(P)/FAD-dependent oxidoreductase n=1 Tax=Microcoleus sp. PH2017_05_CCC_O_A TaxID=2798816 RepID=UPI001D499C08|nr:NAD(P)/FAD-dependent oxidoreductase [Microcoleus sp. PH2017_05_CCC_O_A]TAG04549.1 MAG: NAD(P)/FAD-dependent oxidoreductase [Oscillatoriales cyanobacterium]MCC3438016.1 NAD(P)/FAD-dependent oxidoreductase [Microcoleus sp. PH2017_05_CCC_O_A]TAG14399.1 MAG: NAD(P)/FAD-dependent oxidoreductase [Oscillatoriales cyanobacterium]TAG42524.1 MAG: NAD(P)/FAD-dependent oxidoreductase [Oscillatoriales cyanobacterium]TAG58372.1 MAG: NAD(P)/FAD-dependent oxidoreductase [Oscillatoriales cyanobacterium]
MLKITVIGGGAAGFFSAITCAKTYPQARVTLLEAGRQVLAKVRISGGGRCNVTHACFDPGVLVQNYPRGGKALRGAFTRFQPRDTVDWFASHGVKLKTEEDGRMFPITDDSATIVNCLIRAAEDAGVRIRTGDAVVSVKKLMGNGAEDGHGDIASTFEVELKSGESFKCDRILLATGSNPSGFKWAKELGNTVEVPVPSLFTFNIADNRIKDLAGVSVPNAKVKLPGAKLEQSGPLLITHWGVSGPAVLKLSAWGARFLHDRHYRTSVLINWLPQYNAEVLRQQLLGVKSQLSHRLIVSSCPFPMPRRLWERLTSSIGIDEQKRWADLSNKAIDKLLLELVQGEYQIAGKGAFKEEFVTCGGVNLKEVDFKTMESRRCPGLFFAGEILDIDGVTGGFNFQSAWTTAWLAGIAIGK